MNWRRFLDLLAVSVTGAGLWIVAVFLWPFFGPVGIVIVLLFVVLGANTFDFLSSLLGQADESSGGGPGSPVAVGHAQK
jgi:hypothetical protein